MEKSGHNKINISQRMYEPDKENITVFSMERRQLKKGLLKCTFGMVKY